MQHSSFASIRKSRNGIANMYWRVMLRNRILILTGSWSTKSYRTQNENTTGKQPYRHWNWLWNWDSTYRRNNNPISIIVLWGRVRTSIILSGTGGNSWFLPLSFSFWLQHWLWHALHSKTLFNSFHRVEWPTWWHSMPSFPLAYASVFFYVSRD